MKTITTSEKVSTDGMYSVSAADVADKIIARIQLGLGPQLFRRSALRFISISPIADIRSRKKVD
jgi:hypothetical protein